MTEAYKKWLLEEPLSVDEEFVVQHVVMEMVREIDEMFIAQGEEALTNLLGVAKVRE